MIPYCRWLPVLGFFPLVLYSWIMPITFLLSAQWAALSLRMASVSSLLKPQAVNRPRFTMRNQTFFVSGKQSAVLFRGWPTMHCLCALRYTSAHTHKHHPHASVTSWKIIWLWETCIFGKQNDDSQRRKYFCNERHMMQLVISEYSAFFLVSILVFCLSDSDK